MKYVCLHCKKEIIHNGSYWEHADGITYRHPCLPLYHRPKKINEGWISVNEYVPDCNENVLVYAPRCTVIDSILIGRYFDDTNSWTVYDFHESKLNEIVTHWMPLPDKP